MEFDRNVKMTAMGGQTRTFLLGGRTSASAEPRDRGAAQRAGGGGKVQSVDQRMRLECGVGFRQLRTCRRTRPGQLCAKALNRFAIAAAVGSA